MQHGALTAPPKNQLHPAPDLELPLVSGKEPPVHSKLREPEPPFQPLTGTQESVWVGGKDLLHHYDVDS